MTVFDSKNFPIKNFFLQICHYKSWIRIQTGWIRIRIQIQQKPESESGFSEYGSETAVVPIFDEM
jgi:hypothetical protein